MCFGTQIFKLWSINNVFDKHKFEPAEFDLSKFDCTWAFNRLKLHAYFTMTHGFDFLGQITTLVYG